VACACSLAQQDPGRRHEDHGRARAPPTPLELLELVEHVDIIVFAAAAILRGERGEGLDGRADRRS